MLSSPTTTPLGTRKSQPHSTIQILPLSRSPIQSRRKQAKGRKTMSAMVASSLNPDAPLLVPSAFRQDMAGSLQAFVAEQDIAGFRPDAIDEDDLSNTSTVHASQPSVTLRTDAVLKALLSPKGGDAHNGFPEKPRYTEKATKYAGSPSPRGGSAPRFIHQPR